MREKIITLNVIFYERKNWELMLGFLVKIMQSILLVIHFLLLPQSKKKSRSTFPDTKPQ